jgi:transcriptional regulator with XRE-family HTH domain
MINYVEIGKQIKIERIRQDITQEQLAEMCKISVSHVSSIECGRTKLGLTVLVQIASALKMSTDVILCQSVDSPASKTVLSNNIANILADCSQYEMIFIEEIVRAATSSWKKLAEKNG